MRIRHGDYDIDDDRARLNQDAVVSFLATGTGILGGRPRMCRPKSTAPGV
jgi:hypothetical protein